MAERHQYFGIEILNMTAGQRQTLIQGLQGLGRADSAANPMYRMQVRIRPDGNAAIFEAVLEDSDLSIAAIKARLAAIFGIAVGTISHSVSSPIFATQPSTLVTFTYSAVARLRMVAFAGASATWDQSRVETVAYLIANNAAWNGDQP